MTQAPQHVTPCEYAKGIGFRLGVTIAVTVAVAGVAGVVSVELLKRSEENRERIVLMSERPLRLEERMVSMQRQLDRIESALVIHYPQPGGTTP